MKMFLLKAPSVVPKIHIKKTWQSHIELTWEEIPLEQRNGIIQGYKIFCLDDKGAINGRWNSFMLVF